MKRLDLDDLGYVSEGDTGTYLVLIGPNKKVLEIDLKKLLAQLKEEGFDI